MDDRQREVRIGAGLEESRINQELLDWLGKWGPRILIVLLVIVAAYQGNRFLEQRERNATNRAFVEYREALGIGDPAVIIEVGDEYEGVGSIWELSRLRAARFLMLEASRGVLMTTVNAREPMEEEIVDAEGSRERFERASELYQSVIDRTTNNPSAQLFRLQAMLGKASAQLSLGNVDDARDVLERVAQSGEEMGYGDLGAVAQRRLETWDAALNPPTVVASAELPESAQPAIDSGTTQNQRQIGADPSLRFDRFDAGDDFSIPVQTLEEQQGDEAPEENAPDAPNVPVRTIDPAEPASDEPAEDPGADDDG